MSRTLLVALALLCLLGTAPPHAVAQSGETDRIRAALGGQFPGAAIDSLRRLPSGLYEVVLDRSEIIYVDAQAETAFVGRLVDLRTRTDLTEKRLAELRRVDFSRLPLDKAIVKVRGDGSRRIAVFSDPDCPYCKQLEPQLELLDNVTIYTFLLPLTALHPDAMRKATLVWCAPDRQRAWDDLMLRGRLPEGGSLACATPILEIVELAKQLGISGTPGIVLADGTLVPGMIPAQELEAKLAATRRGS
jgi:thiol:disulfide interchange protein DsbC